jgi:hypothetical protein
MTAVLLRVILNPKVLLGIAVVAALTLGYLHYTALRSDLREAGANLATARVNLDIAIEAAAHNANGLRKAQQDTGTLLRS